MEEFSEYASLDEFKENYKSDYYGYYKHKNPDISFISYLDKLINFYSSKERERAIFINKNKDKLPDWINTDEEKDLWYKGLDFDKKLKNEFNSIKVFLYDEREILKGQQSDIEILITEITKVTEKKQKIDLSAPERLQLLWDLGFDDLPKVKELDDGRYKKLMITILNYTPRDIEGYINSRKENSKESRFIITDKHIDTVKKHLNNL